MTTTGIMNRRFVTALLLIAGLILSLTACGVRGPLEPPVDQTVIEGEADAEGRKPHRGFILDGLL